MSTYLIALVLGTLFGFALNKAGLTKYHKIVNVFRFTDMAVLQFMMTALVVGQQRKSTLGSNAICHRRFRSFAPRQQTCSFRE